MPILYRPDRRPSAGSWLSKGGSDETSCVRGGLPGNHPCSPKETRYGALRRCGDVYKRQTTTNTRMRDFYDIYILDQLHGNTLNRQTLYDALLATAKKRGTERHLAEAVDVLNEVESSPVMQKLWESYRRKFSYAADLEWNIIMRAVRSLYALSEKESSL